jgi:hypothetical protein
MVRAIVTGGCVLLASGSWSGCAMRGADAIDTDSIASLPVASRPGAPKPSSKKGAKSPSSPRDEDAQPEDQAGVHDDAEINGDEPATTNTTDTTGAKAAARPTIADEACAEPRVSYSKPCHDDRDPCALDSGWSGDEYCWPAPPKGEGIQIHIGPKDYGDADEIAKYVIEPGEEFDNSVVGHVPLTSQRWYNRTMVRMRPGSHHWIGTLVAGRPEARFYADADQNCGADKVIGPFGGGQNLIYDNPPGGVAAPENQGVGSSLPGNSSLCVNLHAYNFSNQPRLREMWINLYFVDERDVTQKTESIGVVAGLGMSIPPGMSRTLSYGRTINGTGRIVQLYGHRHVWTPRFAVWLNDDLVYDSWSWQESATFNYDSITQNPAPMPDKKVDGAKSGPLPVKPGDVLTFSCFIENNSDRTLTWRNELREGEMCNLWGATVGPNTGLSGSLQ